MFSLELMVLNLVKLQLVKKKEYIQHNIVYLGRF